MSTADSVTVEPISPASLSTVRTSSTDALSCLPPQRTIAYTKDSLFLGPACRTVSAEARVGFRRRSYHTEATGFANMARSSPSQCDTGTATEAARRADDKEYQTARPAVASVGSVSPALGVLRWVSRRLGRRLA